jgi:hypothetical protein
MKKFILTLGIVLLSGSLAFGMPILGGSFDGTKWSAFDAQGRSASAEFSIVGSTLHIELLNTASSTTVPNTGLAGIIFNYTGASQLSNPNITAQALSDIISPFTLTWGTNLNGEWGYLSGSTFNSTNGGLGNYGLSNSAFDPMGFSTPIDPSKSYPPPSPNGIEFGIVCDNTVAGNESCLNGLNTSAFKSWVIGGVDISLASNGTLNLDNINQVNFLYGTSFTNTSVPEPGTILLLGSGLLGLGFLRNKFKK